MSIAARMLPGFDQLIGVTKQHLMSIPDDRLDWRPPRAFVDARGAR